MSEKVYVDTNVIIDYLLDRNSYSSSFIRRGILCNFHFVISDLVLKELSKSVNTSLITWLLLLKKITITKTTPLHKKLAARFDTHYADAIHAAHAKVLGIRLVTQNIRDFRNLGIVAVKPDAI